MKERERDSNEDIGINRKALNKAQYLWGEGGSCHERTQSCPQGKDVTRAYLARVCFENEGTYISIGEHLPGKLASSMIP